jgi:tRNA1(Val) A37 N6-methylase TrmN6
MKLDNIITINNIELSKKYIQSLSKEERLALVKPIFDTLREIGWVKPEIIPSEIHKSFNRLVEYKPDTSSYEIFNNSDIATDICKHFCHEKFYSSTEKNKDNHFDIFNNDKKLTRVIQNRLGLDWIDADERGPGVNEAFNLTHKMIQFQAPRSMRLVPSISIFKPIVAKYMAMKYLPDGGTVYDYSAGWGGRLLGTIAAGKSNSKKYKYIAVDPNTATECNEIAKALQIDDQASVVNDVSESFALEENSVDLAYSSPPYYTQEFYSADERQAYNKGEDYYYNQYWYNTLANCHKAVKPGGWFGLNVKNVPKMYDMAVDMFGVPTEEVQLETVRSHLNKTAGVKKYEAIYMWKLEK